MALRITAMQISKLFTNARLLVFERVSEEIGVR
jgi:hypothetical protein